MYPVDKASETYHAVKTPVKKNQPFPAIPAEPALITTLNSS